VTWATSVPFLVFLGLSVLDLGPMYATDVRRQTASSLNAPWAGHNKYDDVKVKVLSHATFWQQTFKAVSRKKREIEMWR